MFESSNILEFIIAYMMIILIVGAFFIWRVKTKADVTKYTLRLIERWNEPVMVEAALVISNLSGEEIDLQIPGEAVPAMHIINFFEEVGISVEAGIVSDRIARDYFSDYVVDNYKRLQFIIYKQRKEYRNESLYRNFEYLAKRYSISTGE